MPHRHHNLLHAKPAYRKPVHPAVKVLSVTAVTLMFIAGVTALIVAPFWYISEKVYSRLEAAKADLELAQQAASELRFQQAAVDIESAEAQFAEAKEQLQALQAFSGAPFIGPHIVAADHLIDSGASASSAIRDVLGVAEDIAAVVRETEGLSGALQGSLPDAAKLFKDLTPEQKRRMLAAFADGVPDMRDALAKIDAAIASYDEIPQDEIAAQFAESLKPFRAKLLSIREGIAAILPLAETVPKVLGYPDAKNYLFFFQNNTELRPTGGFLGVFGLATVKDADLFALVTDDVYALDGPSESTNRPTAPAPIRKYIGIEKWYLRDANWSPDFVASSSIMAQFFTEEAAIAYGTKPPPVDGIVAVDPEFAKDILRITGPLTVDGKTFTADNLVDELEFAVEKGFVEEGIAFHERKAIVGKLVQAVIDKLKSLPVSRLVETIGVVHRNLKEGHILLSMRDHDLQAIVLNNDWGGKLKNVRGDYLSVIDANLASLKSDPAVQRSIAYAITPRQDGQYVASVRITYEHKGRFDWKTTRYRTYTRIYVPQGSTFQSVIGAMENDKLKDPARRQGKADVGDEIGRKWFGAFISIEPGEKRTLEFRYLLSPGVVSAIKEGTYVLDFEKQAGTVAHGLTLDLDFGKKLTSAEPPEDRSQWGDGRYRFTSDLRIDRAFDIGL